MFAKLVYRIGVCLVLAALIALLAPKVAALEGRFANINGENLYHEVDGQGPPVVLIHGWSLNLRMWDAGSRAEPALPRDPI